MRFQEALFVVSVMAADAFTIHLTHQSSTASVLRMAGGTTSTPPSPPPPVLNGKMVLPYSVMKNGLEGHQDVAAVYAVMDKNYKRGQPGWKECVYVGTTLDLQSVLSENLQTYGEATVANIRALSFSFPQKDAMDDVAKEWREQALDAGAILEEWDEELRDQQIAMIQSLGYDDDEEEEDLDFDDIDLVDLEMMGGPPATPPPPPPSQETQPVDGGTVTSPFASSSEAAGGGDDDGTQGPLEFTLDNVDNILDEVRPYLIADGGNVAVVAVDTEKKNVYLKLEGACGSCPSSTVTMQMGIERVLKENFADLGEVLQVSDVPEAPTELTVEAVQQEVNRIAPAITAMGGVVEILSVDPIGVVELKFRGANKVKQGLELALLDVPMVKHVNFVMES